MRDGVRPSALKGPEEVFASPEGRESRAIAMLSGPTVYLEPYPTCLIGEPPLAAMPTVAQRALGGES